MGFGMNTRYFRASSAVYEQIRQTLDAAWGYPDTTRKTETCMRPASELPRDQQRRIYVAMPSEFCEYEAVAAVLPNLIQSGAVDEISEQEYRSVVRQPATPRRR